MLKNKLIVLLVALVPILSTSCEKEEDPYVNNITFNGTAIYNVTSLLYGIQNDSHIVYFSRFVDGGEINQDDYVYCIVDKDLLGTDVDILNCADTFEWVIVIDGNNYFLSDTETDFFANGSFKVDVTGENFYTVEANFTTFDYKSISINWQGYFSYSVFNSK